MGTSAFLAARSDMLSLILISLLISSGVSENSGTASTLVRRVGTGGALVSAASLKTLHVVKRPDAINAPRPFGPQLPGLRAVRLGRIHLRVDHLAGLGDYTRR